MADAPKLKDYFTTEVVREIGERVASHYPSFSVDDYMAAVRGDGEAERFEELAFTARTLRIAEAIDAVAALEPPAMFELLVRSLPPELDQTDGVLNDGFTLWPYGDLIAMHGAAFPSEGLTACYELTKRFTAEYAIRPILAASPAALTTVAGWTSDENEHVRRLASEGTRPRLPWATRLSLPVDEVLVILSQLRADPSPYVRKSVANHLNDLAKDDADRIIAVLADWHAEDVPETRWIVRHALRNHLKDGTPAALAIFDYLPPEVVVNDMTARPASPALGDTVELSFALTSTGTTDQKLMVDVVMGYTKANGKLRPKVFKFREIMLEPGATESCTTTFDMVNRVTRKLYPGEHSLTVRVNGRDLTSTTFDLN